ncbi:FG-GAP-like repeat-containing protein [Streptomyces sp. OfavH-34-F]|uniref:FG-GAP-like repeat-containing protein n=1 Tax=Streptomyces sp. OfavH-34-F TaxID=2917760 RepID=UPI001EF322E4|nr:FG-GAP-like repeat-containing protein [Streptomyces sp. OfavH-34-F]MCG7524187.1 FG-GAP-like repeat-containing protein [Streptomyces sp. OfavH-34-F]
MTVPRPLRPFVRSRTRLSVTLGLLVAALTASLLPLLTGWPGGGNASPRSGGAGTKASQAGDHPRTEAEAIDAARRTGKKVLVEAATTATTLTWALPGGKMRQQIHATPQRARNADGEWAPIDTTLRRTEDGIAPANAVTPVRFAAGSRTERADRGFRRDTPAAGESILAEVELEGHTVAYTWPGPLPVPVLDGPRALYQEVFPGVDLLLVAREEGGLAQLLIVKTPEAARNEELKTLTFGLRSATARFEHNSTTDTLRVLDSKKGREIGSVPTPFAWDSSGRDPELEPGAEAHTATATSDDVLALSGLGGIEPGAQSSLLRTAVHEDDNGVRLALDVAGTGLLQNDAVRYPLFIDPSIMPPAKSWTVAYKPYPNSSFYNGTNFSSGTSDARVGYESDTKGLARSFWAMNFSSVLKGADITSATFKVLNNHAWSCEVRQFHLYRTGAISSGTTWNKQPSWSSLLQSQSFAHGYNSSCSDDYVKWNVRAGAQYAADNGASTLTLGMRANTETSVYTWRKFHAESAVLEVDYNRKPKEPTGGTTTPGGACLAAPASRAVAKTNIVLSATATDPDGNLSKLRFRWWKSGATAPAGTLVTPNSSGKATLTIPSSSLADKTTYKWDVRSEDSAGAVSTYFPPGDQPCQFTVDGSAPPSPDVASVDFPEATPDGLTWSEKKFGTPGVFTFSSPGAVKFSYTLTGADYIDKAATAATDEGGNPVGVLTLTLAPPTAGPNSMRVYAYDAVGNKSKESTDYTFYVPPRDTEDAPGDLSGDGRADLLTINPSGDLRSYPGLSGGELYTSLAAGYTSDGSLNPTGHWYDLATGKAALITHYADAYPGDGVTDLFARTPDGGFWLYPGDGYGSFDVGKRMEVRLPAGAPDPASWVQLKAVGDVTGDRRPEVFLRTGDAFWVLLGYTGGTFQEAVQLSATAWEPRDIVNVADIDLDGTPDLLWRNTSNGNMYIRHGKAGAVSGGVDLNSLKTAAASREGKDTSYGTGWTGAKIDIAMGIPDVNGDRIPDIWARFTADGSVKVYHPSATNTNPAAKTVIYGGWENVRAFG